VNSLARNALPMGINLALAASCNLRSLFKTAVARRCHVLQGTFWNLLLDQMKAEVMEKVDPRIGRWFDLQPCDVAGRCTCLTEQQPRIAGDDQHAPCPRLIQHHFDDREPCPRAEGCVGCLKWAREHGVSVSRRTDR
jgi:hypothetical protein